MRSSLGPVLVTVGAVLVILGLLVWSGMLAWLGPLPGDIRIVRPNTRIYIPIASMVILSIVLSVAFAVVPRLM